MLLKIPLTLLLISIPVVLCRPSAPRIYDSQSVGLTSRDIATTLLEFLEWRTSSGSAPPRYPEHVESHPPAYSPPSRFTGLEDIGHIPPAYQAQEPARHPLSDATCTGASDGIMTAADCSKKDFFKHRYEFKRNGVCTYAHLVNKHEEGECFAPARDPNAPQRATDRYRVTFYVEDDEMHGQMLRIHRRHVLESSEAAAHVAVGPQIIPHDIAAGMLFCQLKTRYLQSRSLVVE
ncbi:hypothetical protein Hypma_002397 [Hypsizygus marmoreus]|uniref:Uncharacterized protein n=1 Tax=Hypsizygus marmoreus TaxID=39966 RepID=A0A369J8J3_HYPMA|nr:hypothetical protein Hypma_002397 [Hypsizygus marmoreus]